MFLDTAGLLTLHDQNDPRHADAVAFFAVALRRVTHNYVLAGFVALAQARRLDRRAACDAVSFIVMDMLELGEALTTDKHFEQAGFRRLLA